MICKLEVNRHTAKLLAAYRAAYNALVRACCDTGGLNSVSLNRIGGSMSELINGDSLAADFLTAYGTVGYVIVRACCRAACANRVLYYSLTLGMSERRNGDSLAAKLLAAYGTVGYVIVRACCRAACANRVLYYSLTLGMSECINRNSHAAKLLTAYGTVNYVVVRAVVSAIGCNVVLYYSLTLGVSECVNYSLRYDNLAAYRAVLALGKTGGCAIGCYRCINYLGMTDRKNDPILAAKLLAAYGTVDNLVVVTGIYAVSRDVILHYSLTLGVAVRKSEICNIAVAAYRAGVGGIATLSAGRSDYNSLVAVPLNGHSAVYKGYVVVGIKTVEPLPSGDEAADGVAVILNRLPVDLNERDNKPESVALSKTVNSPAEAGKLTEVNGNIVHGNGDSRSLDHKLANADSNAILTVVSDDYVVAACIGGSVSRAIESVEGEVKNLNLGHIHVSFAVNAAEDDISDALSVTVVGNLNPVICAEAYVVDALYDNESSCDRLCGVNNAVQVEADEGELLVYAEAKLILIGGENYPPVLGINAEEDILDILVCKSVRCLSTKTDLLKEIKSVDAVLICVDPVESNLLQCGIDEVKTCIHIGHVVRIGYNADNKVDAYLAKHKLLLIDEGNGGILVKLCKSVAYSIENSRLYAKLLKLRSNLVNSRDELGYGKTVLKDLELSKDLVDPSGKVYVDSTLKCIKTKLGERAVAVKHSGDYGHVNTLTEIGTYGDKSVGGVVASVLTRTVIYGDVSLGRLDGEGDIAYTEINYSTLLVACGVLNDQLVYTCVYGCDTAVVELSVRLNANEEDINTLVGKLDNRTVSKSDADSRCLSLAVVGEVGVCNLNLCGVGNDDYLAVNGVSIVNRISDIKKECNLCINTVVKLLLVGGENDSAVIGNTNEDVYKSLSAVVIAEDSCVKVVILEVVPGEDVVAVSSLAEADLYLLCIGVDNKQARCDRGIMVGVGNYRDVKVCTDLGVALVILEGNGGLGGKLCHEIKHLVNDLGVNSKLSYKLLSAVEITDKVSCADRCAAVNVQDIILSKKIIKPCGKVYVYVALYRLKTLEAVKVCAETERDNGGVGSETGYVNRGSADDNGMLLAVPLNNVVLYAGGGPRRLDSENADALTCVSDNAVSVTDNDDSGHGVHTCVYGSSLRCVGHTVSLYAYVVVADIAICEIDESAVLILNYKVKLHAVLRGVVKLEVAVVIYVSVAVAEVYVKALGYNYYRTRKQVGVVDLVAPVNDHGKLEVCTDVKSLSTNPEGYVAVDVHTDEQIEYLGGSGSEIAVCSIGRMRTCLEGAVVEISIGDDVVIVLLVPVDLGSGSVGIDSKHADAERGIIVSVSAYSAEQIYANARGHLAAELDLDVGILGNALDAVKHIEENVEVLLVLCSVGVIVKSVNYCEQLAELNARAVCKADISAEALGYYAVNEREHLPKLLGKEKLNGGNKTLKSATLDVNGGNVKTYDKLDEVKSGRRGNEGISVALAVLNNLVVDLNLSGSLGDGDAEAALRGLVALVTRELNRDDVSLVGYGELLHGEAACKVSGVDIAYDNVAVLIDKVCADSSPKLLVGVGVILEGNVVTLYISVLTSILKCNGSIGSEVVCLCGILDTDLLDHGIGLGSIVTEVVSMVIVSSVVYLIIDILNLCEGSIYCSLTAENSARSLERIESPSYSLLGEIEVSSLLERNTVLNLLAVGGYVNVEPHGGHVKLDVITAENGLKNGLKRGAEIQLVDVDNLSHLLASHVLDNDAGISPSGVRYDSLVNVLVGYAGHANVVVESRLVLKLEGDLRELNHKSVIGRKQCGCGKVYNSGSRKPLVIAESKLHAVIGDSLNVGSNELAADKLISDGSCYDGNAGCSVGIKYVLTVNEGSTEDFYSTLVCLGCYYVKLEGLLGVKHVIVVGVVAPLSLESNVSRRNGTDKLGIGPADEDVIYSIRGSAGICYNSFGVLG